MIPDITLIVPLFSRPRTLARILASLDGQSLAPSRFEAIFVDDSGPESYQNQKSVLDGAKTCFSWTYLTTGLPREVNGVSVARNLAIRKSKGTVLVFMDDDCVPHPDLLQSHLKAHRADPELMAIGNRGPRESFLGKSLPLPAASEKCEREAAKSEAGKLGPGSFVTANASVRKNHVVAAGLFDESFAQKGEYGYEDRDLGRRLQKMGLRFRFLPDAFVWTAPKESDAWEGKKEMSANAGRRRYQRKHDLFQPVRRIWKKLTGRPPGKRR